MEGLTVLLIGVPLVVYVSLCLLPMGKPAAIGIAVALLAAGLVQRVADDPLPQTLATLVIGGVAVAALVQGVRAAIGERLPPFAYPAMAVVAFPTSIQLFRQLFGA
jgi:hypothetical protein